MTINNPLSTNTSMDYWLKEAEKDASRRLKKQRDERKDKFNKKFEEFSKDRPIKCLSDKGLLYLRYGIDRLRDFYGKNYIIDEEEKFEDYCTRFYNDRIRGDIEFTNKSMLSNASSLLYICCIIRGINITQKDMAEIYNISEATVRSNYAFMRKLWKF